MPLKQQSDKNPKLAQPNQRMQQQSNNQPMQMMNNTSGTQMNNATVQVMNNASAGNQILSNVNLNQQQQQTIQQNGPSSINMNVQQQQQQLQQQQQMQPQQQTADMQKAYQTLGLTYDSTSNAMGLPASFNRPLNSTPISLISNSAAIQNTNQNASSTNLSWQSQVSQELRLHLVQKIVSAIIPSSDLNTAQDKRMNSLVQYAQKVESDMYVIAKSREEYYQLLAKKICNI